MSCSRNAFRMRLMMAMKKSRKPRKKSRKRKSGKRPLNEFMKKKEAARKGNKKTFTYKGHTYVRGVGGSKGQLVVYRKKSGMKKSAKRKSPKKKSAKRKSPKRKSSKRKKKSSKRK